MRAVSQRVSSASVEVDGTVVGAIGRGWLVLLGVAKGDTTDDADWLASKVVGLRAFEDSEGKMNLDVGQVDGGVLVVSQFTLLADCRKGRRPGFDQSENPAIAEPLYEFFVDKVREAGVPAQTGVFRAAMNVALVNDGPVTFLLDSKRQF